MGAFFPPPALPVLHPLHFFRMEAVARIVAENPGIIPPPFIRNRGLAFLIYTAPAIA